jgi:hypothetical protein
MALCQSGSCVGSNPVVCPAPLCRQPGTCDPSSGVCSSCPAGYTQGAGGCQKTYAIDASLLDNQNDFCDGTGANRFNGCFGPFGFHWTDTGDASVGAVIRVDVQIEAGIDCSGLSHRVSINATTIGTYVSEPFSCACFPPHAPRLFSDVNKSSYGKGGVNSVSIDTNSCTGLSRDANGHYALVTVTYEDPELPLGLRTGCRQAAKSKLKYEDGASDDKDKLSWSWGKGEPTTQEDLADPTMSADYQFCVFREAGSSPTVLFEAEIPAGAALWKKVGNKGYKYTDRAASQGGIGKILAKGGPNGKAKILVKGVGAGLSDPTLPLSPGTTGIRVQLSNESSGVCWESEFPFGTVLVDDKSIKGKAP